MRVTASGAMKTRQSSRNLSGFGKCWKSGDTVTVLYPLVREPGQDRPDLLVAGVFGHSVDVKQLGLKRVFIPTNAEIDEYGKPKAPDTLFQFSKLAKAFIEGERKEKEDNIQNNKASSAAQKQAALKKIEEDFEDIKGVVGPLKMVISTECIVVPMVNDVPDVKNAKLVTQDMSDERIRGLIAIINDPQYKVDKDARFVEIKYSFGNSGDKKVDGKVNPLGITEDYRIEKRYPDAWETIKTMVDMLPTDSDVIEKRNGNYRPVSEVSIIKALSDYSALNYMHLDALADDKEMSDRIKGMKEIIQKLNIPLSKIEFDEDPVENTEETAATTAQAVDFAAVLAQDLEVARSIGNAEAEDDESISSFSLADD